MRRGLRQLEEERGLPDGERNKDIQVISGPPVELAPRDFAGSHANSLLSFPHSVPLLHKKPGVTSSLGRTDMSESCITSQRACSAPIRSCLSHVRPAFWYSPIYGLGILIAEDSVQRRPHSRRLSVRDGKSTRQNSLGRFRVTDQMNTA